MQKRLSEGIAIMGITAKELAKELMLSEAAVSMALNNKSGVSTKTRQRVLEAARNRGYDFSKITQEKIPSGTVYFIIFIKHGAVVSETPFFSQLTEGVEKECRNAGYKFSICHLYDDSDLEKEMGSILYSDCIGIILLGTEMTKEDFHIFEHIRVPVVLLDTYHDSPKMDCVLINNVEGAFKATSHLIKKCKKQPGYLHSSYSIFNFEERADGFYKAVRKNGMSTSNSITHLLSPSVEGAYADMKDLLSRQEPIAECYFADNDAIAVGAIKAFKEFGYRIPFDISIVGFDNMPFSAYIDPGLTTIHVPKQYMGSTAAKRLITVLSENEFYPVKIEIETSLLQRGSVTRERS